MDFLIQVPIGAWRSSRLTVHVDIRSVHVVRTEEFRQLAQYLPRKVMKD